MNNQDRKTLLKQALKGQAGKGQLKEALMSSLPEDAVNPLNPDERKRFDELQGLMELSDNGLVWFIRALDFDQLREYWGLLPRVPDNQRKVKFRPSLIPYGLSAVCVNPNYKHNDH